MGREHGQRNPTPLDPAHAQNLGTLAIALQQVRGVFHDTQVLQGYCSPALAECLSLPADSPHRVGRAVLLHVPGVGGQDVARRLLEARMAFDTLAVRHIYLSLTVPEMGQPWRKLVTGLLEARR